MRYIICVLVLISAPAIAQSTPDPGLSHPPKVPTQQLAPQQDSREQFVVWQTRQIYTLLGQIDVLNAKLAELNEKLPPP